ncbi:hypothetical protein [Streptomyces sp. Root369]|uniref:hypothetical protein n=1 Tax=Streptomyces sp. Root369 TaxID=1736523 RepID=UPI00070B4443|nr:hypothetical protein [Streptomyces sp. Root369]KQV94255.1 hypothetical protein ASD08_14610 [Streptomyces sp. Root369]
MTVGWCSRALRAAVFAAVCVLLTSLGHVVMSETAVPWWAMAAGAAVTGGTAWLLAGRERGPVLVGSVVVAAQAVLHVAFSLAQAVVHPEPSRGGTLTRQWLGYLLGESDWGPGAEHDASSAATGSMDHAMGAMHSMGSMDHMGAGNAMDHGMGGISSTGMLAAHLLAALMCGLWLAHGERAVFRILRVLAGWLIAPLRLLLRLPAPPHRPRVRARRAGSERALRRLLLTHAITSRGPPVGVAAA